MSNSKMSSWNHSKLSSWSPVGAIGSIALFFALVFLAACTDYVDQMEGDFEDWKAEQARESSDSAQTSRSDLQSSSSREELSSSSNQFNPDIKYGELLDSRDGHTYKSVKIGSQTWMAENLNYETDDTYCPDGKSENCSTYGRLYNWNTAKTVCPAGWHLPSKDEWNTLLTAVGGASTAGKAIKSASGWRKSGNCTDAFGFSAIPTGYRDGNKEEYGNGYSAYFWSSTEYGSSGAYFLSLDDYYASALGYYSADSARLDYYDGVDWRSVRCLRDEGETVQSSSSVTQQSSSSSKVGEPVEPAEVTTGTMTDSRDGQTYKTVTIGIQTWMAQNLNYETANSYCYKDSASNCTKYGRLYTWAAATTACPEGWHLPTEEEFETLFTAVGGQSTAGKVLKSTSGWDSSCNGSDAFAFSALPAGLRLSYGEYSGEGIRVGFWSSTEGGSDDAYDMYLHCDDSGAYLCNDGKNYGFSVRCLKDEGETVQSSSSVTQQSSSSKKVESSSSKVTEPAEVTTGTMTDSRDGQTYKTVKIGSQTWMAENLNFKTDSSFCYSNNETNCTTYGRLYTWTAAVSACPSGWHLPSYDEWNTLFTAVGGASTAGPVLRATSGWYGNGNGSDNFGFSVLPAGNYDQGYFNNREDEASFWMADEFNSESASYARLRYWEAYVYLGDHYKYYGLSVRCLKD
ncbi:major paralogous domain-containing protein [Fibrobacter sp. UWR3]|uniref:fibrobacter succinogenes major paralogous domain-containing protein n=1 Tax=Fibrobacter sp. UWR3 TaxID=1896217 RepID=UPI0009173610|nr:fibrobacter succinogenes major paralogous domain-containing protein [Fibrobacter sp. UWR3]SHM35375.1 major paralogous domain-containing protein [Fibrobacter sp. UWR3]